MPNRTSTDDPRLSSGGARARLSAQEASGPPLAPLRADEHLLEPIITRAEQDPFKVVAAYREGPGFVDVTAAELLERVRSLAKGLIASDVQVGDHIAIMSRTRLEWVVADYAILAVGAATVSIYETSAAAQVEHIMVDSGAILALVENDEMSATVEAIGEESPSQNSPMTTPADKGVRLNRFLASCGAVWAKAPGAAHRPVTRKLRAGLAGVLAGSHEA